MTIVDYVLVAALVLLLPAEAVWVTVRSRPKRPLAERLVRSIRMVGALLTLLFVLWWWHGRPLALLGLEVPLSTTGAIAIAASLAILGLLAATILLKKPTAEQAAKEQPGSDMLPQTQAETRLFVIFSLLIGAGWELLYRGYLLWALSPLMGPVGAVVVAATAYGLAHGTKDVRALIGAVIMSFVFTIAFALTGSLWWLIILHTGLPMIGLLAGRVMQAART